MQTPPLGRRHRSLVELTALAHDPRARRAQARCVVDAPRAISGALDRGVAPFDVFVETGASSTVRALVDRCVGAGASVRAVVDGSLERVAQARTTQGVVAVLPAPRASVADLDLTGRGWAPLLVALVSIGDPGNLGTIVRSADAAGATGVIVGPGSVDVYNPKTIRGSAGAVFGLPVVEGEVDTVLEGISSRMATGAAGDITRIAAVAHGGEPLDRIDLTGPVALVLGHETRGLDGVACDAVASIPMRSGVESLNVAMAATILTYEAARQRRATERRR